MKGHNITYFVLFNPTTMKMLNNCDNAFELQKEILLYNQLGECYLPPPFEIN